MPEEPLPNNESNQTPGQPALRPIVSPPAHSRKKLLLVVLLVLALLLVGGGLWWWFQKNSSERATHSVDGGINSIQGGSIVSGSNATGLQLDLSKNYGDKYADGLLPVGDNMYTTSGGKKGYVYVCNANFVPASQAGAQTRGPWFANNNTQWDSSKKVSVRGNVSWQQNISVKIENGKRVVTTNDLPDHHTGVFPVASSDPAHAYDSNPNSISSQSLTYNLAASPTYGDPQCVGGEVGVMLTGVALFDAFDAGGRDAGAWEVQDSCDGHPQNKGEYHYHTLSRCIKDISVQTVIGYALDGFPITGPKVGDKNILTTSDLDECHGIMSSITLDGKQVLMYHYVMTQDFPYSVSCFRATAIKAPGIPETQTTGTGGQQQPPTGQQLPPGSKPVPY
jgi:hypothetical protein